MSLSMYQASNPIFIRILTNLSAILAKAEAHAESKKLDPSIFIHARLFPDMFPLSRQIQIATDTVKGCAARLAGAEVPSFPDTETSFPELQERIAKTIAFLQSINAGQIDGSEARKITLKIAGKEIIFEGQSYLLTFVIPNFYFHVAMAYALLRHNGVEIGKIDFLGKP